MAESLKSPLLRTFEVKRVRSSGRERVLDTVAVEEPLEIRVSYWFKDQQLTQNLALTMRTPGSDRELVTGYLVSEGIIRTREDLNSLRVLGTNPSNEIVAELAREVDFEEWRLARNGIVNSSCGVCGKRSRESIAKPDLNAEQNLLRIDSALIERLPALLGEFQEAFAKTGGLHAAALVNGSGEVERAYEDIGRHNALDKLIGWCLLEGRLPLSNHILFLSSRSSFELVQKTIMAGARVLATVGGPSSLAIETARDYGVTLIGFVRDSRFNVYSGEWRINL
jgi:FdhD protein